MFIGEGIELLSLRSLFKMESKVMKKRDDAVNEERRWGLPWNEKMLEYLFAGKMPRCHIKRRKNEKNDLFEPGGNVASIRLSRSLSDGDGAGARGRKNRSD